MSSTNDQHDTVPGEESPCGVKFQSLEPLYKLIYLAKNGDADEIKILLEKQEFTDVVNDADNNEKYTPLMWAAVEGQTKVVEILCQNPVVNINGRGGWVR